MALSLEVQSLIAYLAKTGVSHRVTAILGRYISPSNPCSPHVATSNHCAAGTGGQGLAIDVAEPTASYNSPGLLAIFAAFGPVESRLSELIYSGAPYSIKDGRRVPRYAVDAHWNHVHVAVPRGTLLVPIQKPIPDNEGVTTAVPDPNAPPDYDLTGTPCSISAVFDSNGNVKGYYVLTDDGSIAALGNIPYLGRVH